MEIDALFTEEIAATPYEMLVKDCNGEQTGQTLQVITLKAGAFIRANNQYALKNEGQTDISSPEVVQTLIVSWSFETECTKENKIKLLENAPHLIDQIVGFSHSKGQSLFAKKKS